MNHDDHNPDLQPHIDPELEARIVAWVAGEASAFEIAELTRLIGEKPELGIFKRRIEAVHGLVGEAVRPDKEPLRLSSERRAKLLQTLAVPEDKSAEPTGAKVIAPSFEASRKSHRKDRRWLLTLAACVAIGLFTFLSIPSCRSYGDMNAKQSTKLKTPVFAMNLPTVDLPQKDKPASALNSRQELEKTAEASRLAKKTADNLEQSSKTEADEMSSRVASQSRFAGKAVGPLMTSVPLAPPAERNYYGSLSAPSSPPPEFRDGAQLAQITSGHNLQRSSALALNNSFGTGSLSAEKSKPWGGTKAQSTDFARADTSAGYTAQSDEKVTISPFEVTKSNESGYLAKNTLAGTRLNTDLKDLGAPITVVTKQFLSDIEATNAPETQQHTDNQKRELNPEAYPLQAGSNSLAKTKSDKASADDDRPLPTPAQKPAPIAAPVETNAAKEPVSTFSLHVSDVSFRLAQAALANNESIDPARIRPEEFYNAFNYGDPTPSLAEKVSCRVEQAAHPFLQQRNLVRIAVKVAASGRDAAQPLHLTILLDTSGSMEREDRVAIVHRAMKTLVSLLGPNDRITLIGFARRPSLLAESVAGDQSKQILDLIAHVPPEGGTNLEEALKLGGELARRQFEPTAQNRIVLLTDGAANLGNANPAQLSATIEKLRQQGIAFDACGVGFDGLDDTMLENLTRKGDGRYYVLNSPEAADTGFAHQLAGAFRPAAENVKLQVRFNPARVGHYRLIGFEQHRLREEDFRNDSVDAAELAAEEAAVALYQVEPLPQGEGDLGEVFVRFRDAASGNMVERSWPLSYDPQAPAFDHATPSMQLAGVSALLAEKLRGGSVADSIKLGDLVPVISTLRSHYASEPRVQELVTMFGQLRQRTGE